MKTSRMFTEMNTTATVYEPHMLTFVYPETLADYDFNGFLGKIGRLRT